MARLEKILRHYLFHVSFAAAESVLFWLAPQEIPVTFSLKFLQESPDHVQVLLAPLQWAVLLVSVFIACFCGLGVICIFYL